MSSMCSSSLQTIKLPSYQPYEWHGRNAMYETFEMSLNYRMFEMSISIFDTFTTLKDEVDNLCTCTMDASPYTTKSSLLKHLWHIYDIWERFYGYRVNYYLIYRTVYLNETKKVLSRTSPSITASLVNAHTSIHNCLCNFVLYLIYRVRIYNSSWFSYIRYTIGLIFRYHRNVRHQIDNHIYF